MGGSIGHRAKADRGQARLVVVDALRALAVIAVVLFHTFPTIAPGGFIGVDIFFVLSGFVIAHRYLAAMVARTVGFRQFFVRRIQRLVPAYAALLLVTTVAAYYVLPPRQLLSFGESLAGQALYIQNIVFWQQGGYFDDALTKPLLHTWSLGVEEQFYLLFPLLILLMRWHLRTGIVMLAFAVTASLAGGLAIVGGSPETAFYWMPFRIWEFGSGVLVSLAYNRLTLSRMKPGAVVALGFGCLAALVWAILAFGDEALFPGIQAAVAVAATALLCFTQKALPRQALNIAGFPVLQHWGRISYSWYLWHWPPLCFFFIASGRVPRVSEAIVLLIAGYVMAELSYRLVERWGLHSKWTAKPKHAFAMLIGFLLFAAAAGSAFISQRGMLQRYPVHLRSAYSAQVDQPTARCSILQQARWRSYEFCKINEVKGDGGLLLIGDSHAQVVKDMIAELGASNGVPVYLVKRDCRITDYGVEDRCTIADWDRVARDVRKAGVERIFVVSQWSAKFKKSRVDAAFARLAALGLPVFVQLPTPEGRALDPGIYIRGEAVPDGAVRLRDPVSGRLHSEIREAFDRVAREHRFVTLLDPRPVLCPGGPCLVQKDGQLLYSDRHHLTVSATTLLRPLYAPVFN